VKNKLRQKRKQKNPERAIFFPLPTAKEFFIIFFSTKTKNLKM